MKDRGQFLRRLDCLPAADDLARRRGVGPLPQLREEPRQVEQFLPGTYEPAAFALKLAHKDMSLATALGRENGVPMRLANMALEEMTEALNRGWGERDSRVSMLLQEERAGVEIRVPPEELKGIVD